MTLSFQIEVGPGCGPDGRGIEERLGGEGFLRTTVVRDSEG